MDGSGTAPALAPSAITQVHLVNPAPAAQRGTHGGGAGGPRRTMCRDRRERSAYHSTVTATLRNIKLAGSSSHAFPSSSAACAGLRSPSWRLTAGSLPGPRVYSNPPSVLSTTKTLFVTAATLDARRIQRIRNSLDARCTAAAP